MRNILGAILLLAVVACKKPIEGAAPEIEFSSLSKYTMSQNGQDSLLLELHFSDDDGDVGSDTDRLLYVSDNRTDSLLATYLVPRISESDRLRRSEGTISIIVYSGCCRYEDGSSCYANPNQLTDTMRYKIQMSDRGGHLSNVVMSDRITLTCN